MKARVRKTVRRRLTSIDSFEIPYLSLHNDASAIWHKMTLRKKKTEEVCEKFNALETKYHSEKSVLFNLPRRGIKDCEENAIYQKESKYYCEYAIKTQESFAILGSKWFRNLRISYILFRLDSNSIIQKQAKYNFPFYPYGLSLNAYWKTGTQLLQESLSHALLLDLDYTIKMYKKSINIYSPRLDSNLLTLIAIDAILWGKIHWSLYIRVVFFNFQKSKIQNHSIARCL